MVSITVSEISRLDLRKFEILASASIIDVKPLFFYNWIEVLNATPTIAVPGSSVLWSVSGVFRRLKKDSGLIYIAQNVTRHSESPLKPLFRALYITHPSFDIRWTDVVTDRNNIRKFLSFVDPSFTRNGLETFTINIKITKNTAIFCRNEVKTIEYIGPQEFRDFGHEFEKAYTITQVSGSTGHHKIISYRFSNMNFIVRHETDGYVNIDTRTFSFKVKNYILEDIANMVGTLFIFPANNFSDIIPTGSKLIIKEEGQVVPLELTLEIKTRVFYKFLKIQEVAP